MKRGEIGRYETTQIAGESVRAFVPHPLSLDPPVVLNASLQQALESTEAVPCRPESCIGDIGPTSNLSATA